MTEQKTQYLLTESIDYEGIVEIKTLSLTKDQYDLLSKRLPKNYELINANEYQTSFEEVVMKFVERSNWDECYRDLLIAKGVMMRLK